jgi:hypothetical protein
VSICRRGAIWFKGPEPLILMLSSPGLLQLVRVRPCPSNYMQCTLQCNRRTTNSTLSRQGCQQILQRCSQWQAHSTTTGTVDMASTSCSRNHDDREKQDPSISTTVLSDHYSGSDIYACVTYERRQLILLGSPTVS